MSVADKKWNHVLKNTLSYFVKLDIKKYSYIYVCVSIHIYIHIPRWYWILMSEKDHIREIKFDLGLEGKFQLGLIKTGWRGYCINIAKQGSRMSHNLEEECSWHDGVFKYTNRSLSGAESGKESARNQVWGCR